MMIETKAIGSMALGTVRTRGQGNFDVMEMFCIFTEMMITLPHLLSLSNQTFKNLCISMYICIYFTSVSKIYVDF